MYVSRLLLELKVADSTKTNMPYTSRHLAMHGSEMLWGMSTPEWRWPWKNDSAGKVALNFCCILHIHVVSGFETQDMALRQKRFQMRLLYPRRGSPMGCGGGHWDNAGEWWAQLWLKVPIDDGYMLCPMMIIPWSMIDDDDEYIQILHCFKHCKLR